MRMLRNFTMAAAVATAMATSFAAVQAATPKDTLVMADTDRTPFDQGTFGSRTTPVMNLQLRRVAATARAALMKLAAAKWGVDASALEGILRILSFLVLGVALIGIGKLYTAVLDAEAKPKEEPAPARP